MRALLTRSLLTVAGAWLAAGLFAQAPSTVRKGVLEGVTNYSRVGDTVGCAGAITTDSIEALKAEGFASIVNFRLASEPGAAVEEQRAAATARGLRYHHLPFSTSAPDAAVLDRFLAVAADSANSPMFLHCASANRVAAFWLVKRVKQDGWTVDKAIDEATAIGLTNPALKQFALDYLGRTK
jgi:uncharacterized protein (TIGR01244 family)